MEDFIYYVFKEEVEDYNGFLEKKRTTRHVGFLIYILGYSMTSWLKPFMQPRLPVYSGTSLYAGVLVWL